MILEAQRLRIRNLTLADTSFIIKLLNSPGWLQYIGDRNVRNEAEAIAYLENGPLKSYRENGFGLWLVEHKDDQVPIGMCGILKRPDLDTPDIGFAFLPEYHGQGCAEEAARAVLLHAREVLKIPLISAIVQPDNAKSIALLKKNGFAFKRLFSFPGKDDVLEVYSNRN